jgi:pyruvate dehydrogenase (quinone)
VKIVVFNNGALSLVELEMKAAGFVNFGTDLDNPDFAAVARAIGVMGVTVDTSDELEGALTSAFTHVGPALIDVHVARQELSLPPKVTLAQAKGFTLYATRAILSGGADEIIELAKTNLRDLVKE